MDAIGVSRIFDQTEVVKVSNRAVQFVMSSQLIQLTFDHDGQRRNCVEILNVTNPNELTVYPSAGVDTLDHHHIARSLIVMNGITAALGGFSAAEYNRVITAWTPVIDWSRRLAEAAFPPGAADVWNSITSVEDGCIGYAKKPRVSFATQFVATLGWARIVRLSGYQILRLRELVNGEGMYPESKTWLQDPNKLLPMLSRHCLDRAAATKELGFIIDTAVATSGEQGSPHEILDTIWKRSGIVYYLVMLDKFIQGLQSLSLLPPTAEAPELKLTGESLPRRIKPKRERGANRAPVREVPVEVDDPAFRTSLEELAELANKSHCTK